MNQSEPQGIGILSGTFDPVHNGHILLANQAAADLGLSSVYLLTERKPRGKQPAASYAHRKKMLTIAIKNQPKLKLLSLSSPTFSVGDLPVLSALFSGQKIYLIFGSDAYQHSKTWFKPEYSEQFNIHTYGISRSAIARGLSSGRVKDDIARGELKSTGINRDVANYIKTELLYSVHSGS